MAETKTYAQQQTIKYTKKLNELLKILPSFCTEYFNSLEYSKQPRTRVAYAMDIKGFFEFLICEYPQYANYAVKDFTLADLEKLKGQDISDYLRYVKLYDKEGKEVSNSERAAKRKLCALRRFYAYYYRYEMIGENPTLKVDMPKIHDKAITRLDVNEVAEFLDNVESGNKLSKAQLKRHEKLKTRDLALLTLMLGTGIRVSECVGLDMKDVDFDLKVLLTMINDNNNEKGIVNLFHKYFSGKTLDTTIRYRAKPANSATIQNEFLIDSDLNIGNDLKKLVDEVEVYFNDLSVHR